MTDQKIDVYLEEGTKRTIAGALNWPGWCRVAKDEASALEALLAYRERYAHAIQSAGLRFQAPDDIAAVRVVERLAGDASTDFGVPGKAPSADAQPVDAALLADYQKLLQTCWQTLDQAAQAARGRELRVGPRGGGRDLDHILEHVLGAEGGYVRTLGGKLTLSAGKDLAGQMQSAREVILDALAAAVRGELPTVGPRGGARWTPRYFVRRLAWHTLDHAWEIEDRIAP